MKVCPLCQAESSCEECGTLGQFCFGVRPVTQAQVDAFHAVLERRGKKPEPTEEDVLAFVNEVAQTFNGVVKA